MTYMGYLDANLGGCFRLFGSLRYIFGSQNRYNIKIYFVVILTILIWFTNINTFLYKFSQI